MSIADQLTPARNIEITYAPATGLPSSNQTLVLIGHAVSGATGAYTAITVNNVSDVTAASGEVSVKFGASSELTKMVLAAVKANAGGGVFPAITCIPLASADALYGSSGQALTTLQKIPADFVATPYDINVSGNSTPLVTAGVTMSGATRCMNGQFGTMIVGVNNSVTDPSTLSSFDTPVLVPVWNRDSAPAYSLGEQAAALAATLAANVAPFNPVNGVVIQSFPAPLAMNDWEQIGGGLESETALAKGWNPLKVNPNGTVAWVRARTARTSVNGDGVTPVSAYFDVMDYQVLYYWRKTVFARLSQTDITIAKASNEKAKDILGEIIRLAKLLETQGMFQAVDKLAPKFSVSRSTSDRSRFNVFTPVNVIPGLHVVDVTVQATTQFDVITIG